MVCDIDQVQFFWRRSALVVWNRFGVNNQELWFLRALYFACKQRSRPVIGKGEFYRLLTGNRKQWRKYEGYRFGLLGKGVIGQYEVVWQPGSEALGVSDLGMAVLRAHEESLRDLMARYPLPEVIDLGELSVRYRKTA